MTGCDPRALGALCDRCFLARHRQGGPVHGEFKPGARALLIGEAPGGDEVDEGRPFVGASGQELGRALNAIGIGRSEVSLSNALLCRPAKNDLDLLLHRWQKENKVRAKAGIEELPDPRACCRPRLAREIRASGGNLILLGKSALQSVTGISGSIMEMRGGPIVGTLDFDAGDTFVRAQNGNLKVLPTLHPAFILRARRWTRALRADLARAFRWFAGRLEWRDPKVVLAPSTEQVEDWLARHRRGVVAYDVETTVDDPIRSTLFCVGFGTTEEALVVPWSSKERPGEHYWPERDRARVAAAMRAFFLDPAVVKGSWNGGYFDRQVIEHHFGVVPHPILDGIMVHRCVELELPHKLGFVGSIYTDVVAWKADKTGTTAETDAELHAYNATDCVVTARVIPQLAQAVALRDQSEQALYGHVVQSWCVGLHANGMFVDQVRRAEHDARLQADAVLWLKRLREVVGDPAFNPSSVPQVKHLLFDRWDLAPVNFTKLGEPSTDDETLRTYRLDKTMPADRTSFFEALRRFRKAVKLRGTYAAKLRPENLRRATSDLLCVDEEAEQGEVEKGGIVHADGRFRPDYNAHGTKGWRLSSSNPNAQNFPRSLRDMVTAAPGRLLVGADMDQLELRLAAVLAGAGRYLDIFNSGGDPHAETATMLWGAKFVDAAKDDRKRMRDFAKRFSYACCRRGTPVAIVAPDEHDDAVRAVSIEQVRPGDLTTCWTPAAGGRRVSTRVREVRCHGIRACVRIRFAHVPVVGPAVIDATGVARVSPVVEEIVFTPDHLFLLRTGAYKAAGDLVPGDSLMPTRLPPPGVVPIFPVEDATPGRSRHRRVVSVEPAGEHEVWDLEVEHPAHNFALSAGIFVHNCLYRATPETVHDVIVSVENDKGELVYADMERRETALLHKKWLAANPEFEKWWDLDVAEWRRQGFLADPVLGLRCDFLDGENLNDLANFKCQCGGSAVVHLGTEQFVKALPFFYAGPGTGLVNQCHDSLDCEVPGFHPQWKAGEKDVKRQFGWCEPGCRCEASRVAGIMQECLTRRVPGPDILFSASAKIGLRWSEA